MTTIKQLDREGARAAAAAMTAALQKALGPLGLNLSPNHRCRYNFDNASFTFTVALAGEGVDPLAVSPEGKAFITYAITYGLKPEWLGQLVTYRGAQWRICGLLTRSRQYPVLIEPETGAVKSAGSTGRVKVPVSFVVAAFGAKKEVPAAPKGNAPGRLVWALWPEDGEWYHADVVAPSRKAGRARVVYREGDGKTYDHQIAEL